MVNKLFIMLPVMLASRKLDAEDPTQVFWLRVAYGTIQTISVLIVVYTYIQATAIAGKAAGSTIYVSPAAQVRAPCLEVAMNSLAWCCNRLTQK
jgi:Phosphate transport (Pho88)